MLLTKDEITLRVASPKDTRINTKEETTVRKANNQEFSELQSVAQHLQNASQSFTEWANKFMLRPQTTQGHT